MDMPTAVKTPAELIPNCRRVIRGNLDWVVSRCDLDSPTPLIDTKFNVMTETPLGRPDQAGTVYGSDVVYGWIQGRALESLAVHYDWLEEERARDPELGSLADRTLAVLKAVTRSLEALRSQAGGRLSFMTDRTTGNALVMRVDGSLAAREDQPDTVGFTDIFYSKGLFAAATVLEDGDLAQKAGDYVRWTTDRVLAGGFVTDQQPMDPKNPVQHTPGRISHGPTMISVGGAAVMLKHTADLAWWKTGCRLVDHIIETYLCRERYPGLDFCDYLEFVTPEGEPYMSGRQILSDPGHALEFVGLTCKLLAAGREALPDSEEPDQAAQAWLPFLQGVLKRSFALGFNSRSGGICKLVDLRTEMPVNSDMPWWSLPETLRAASLLTWLYPEMDHEDVTRIQLDCWNALLAYLKPGQGCMAIQTRDESGQPIDVIPGCPDADPCYHTGLSLIDAVRAVSADVSRR